MSDQQSPAAAFKSGVSYRAYGAEGEQELRCVHRKGKFVWLVPISRHGHGGSVLRKKVREHEATAYLRGEWVLLDPRRRVYAADLCDD